MALRLIGAALLSGVAFILWAVTSPANTIEPLISKDERVVVTRVLDGDTVVVTGGTKVRYIGIDTPEFRGNAENSECFAFEAKTRNEQLVLGKSVRMEKDVSEMDRYGRLLRYVYIDESSSSINKNTSINEILVNEGFALAITFPPDVAQQTKLKELERNAKDSGRGLWSECR